MTNNDNTIYYKLKELYNKLEKQETVGNTVELLNQTIEFDCEGDGYIEVDEFFRTSSLYVSQEIKWYNSMEVKVGQIAEYASMWGNVSDKRNTVNSNYGFLIFSRQNGYQYDNVLKELQANPLSRRAVMNYTTPFIHYTGGDDYICTQYVSYMIRDGELHAVVSMRSSDIRYGIIGADLAWQIYVLKKLARELEVKPGKVHWHAASLHIYERHYIYLKELFNGSINHTRS